MLQGTVGADDYISDGTVVNQFLRFSKLGVKAVRHADVEHASSGPGRLKHAVRLFDIDCDRLFDQHMLATCQRIERYLAMQIGGKAYADSVDFASEEILMIRVTADAWRQVAEPV